MLAGTGVLQAALEIESRHLARACVARPGLQKCGWSEAWEWSEAETFGLLYMGAVNVVNLESYAQVLQIF